MNCWMTFVGEDTIEPLVKRLLGMCRPFTVEASNFGGKGEYKVYVPFKNPDELSPTGILGTKWGVVPMDRELAEAKEYVSAVDEENHGLRLSLTEERKRADYEADQARYWHNLAQKRATSIRTDVCPKCSAEDISDRHHAGSFVVPECNYRQCNICGHQWGHQ